MKKSTIGLLLVGFVGLLTSVTHTGAAEVNMSIKISPSIPRAGEPVVYEAVLSGEAENKQVAWFTLDPFEILRSISTNGIPSLPEFVYGLTVTNIFQTGGLKETIALIQEAGATNEFEGAISIRIVAFFVQGNDVPVTVQSPNGNELWTPGNTHEVTWTTNAVPSVVITLEQKGTTNITTLAYTENDGSFDFTVPFGTNWVSKGSEGNLGGKNFRVRVAPTDIASMLATSPTGDFGESFTDTSDMSDDWFTIAGGTKLNPAPLTLQNLGFSMANVQVSGAVVGKDYQILSSPSLNGPWETNIVIKAREEEFTKEFYISGGHQQFFRVEEAEEKP